MGKKGLNIYHRKDGRWEGRYKDGFNADGKPKYRSVYAHSYGEVRDILIKIKSSESKPLSLCTLTVEQLFSEWLIYKSHHVKESTIENYRFKIDKHLKAFIADKVQDSDFYVLTLMGIARELYREKLTSADVHLAVGLPLTWVKSQRDSFRQYLTEKENVTFTFRDTEYSVRIVGCTVYPQGYTAVIDRLGEMGGVNMLADIGNGTMNVMYINNKKPVESKCWTEKLGVEQCVIRVKNAVRDNFGTVIEDTHIEQIIRTGTADISPKYLDLIKAVMTDYCKEIFDALSKYEYNPDLVKLFIVGGGSKLIQNFGTYDSSRVTLITDVCATAKGYEWLAYNQLRRCGNG